MTKIRELLIEHAHNAARLVHLRGIPPSWEDKFPRSLDCVRQKLNAAALRGGDVGEDISKDAHAPPLAQHSDQAALSPATQSAMAASMRICSSIEMPQARSKLSRASWDTAAGPSRSNSPTSATPEP